MATSVGDVLTPALIAALATLADGPAVRGIAVLGSAARGDVSRWSDLDIESVVAGQADKWPTRPSFINGRLVMSSSITHDEQVAQLELPDKAIWAVPSYAAMRVLVDRGGGLEHLRLVCRAFDFASLRPAATAYLREKAGSSCEYVFKIRDALERRHESKALHAAAALMGRCERIVAVAFLTPIPTENEYLTIVRAAGGPVWTAAHRSAYGLEGGDAFTQAEAAVRLFRETMRLVDDRLDGPTRGVVGPTLEIAP
ncbi:MAG TPA: hypothetical protein VF001_06520 [Candidatus Limnocylindria bacterium]